MPWQSLSLSLLVVSPVVDCGDYVILLPLLGPAAEQDHQKLAVSAEVNPIPRAEIDPAFVDAKSDSLDVR
jgi:hypothetical protein